MARCRASHRCGCRGSAVGPGSDAAIDDWTETLTADSLAGTFRLTRKGEPRDLPVWWAVTQLFNHQTHHRGQITTLLFQAGQDPGATDVFAVFYEEARSPGNAR